MRSKTGTPKGWHCSQNFPAKQLHDFHVKSLRDRYSTVYSGPIMCFNIEFQYCVRVDVFVIAYLRWYIKSIKRNVHANNCTPSGFRIILNFVSIIMSPLRGCLRPRDKSTLKHGGLWIISLLRSIKPHKLQQPLRCNFEYFDSSRIFRNPEGVVLL